LGWVRWGLRLSRVSSGVFYTDFLLSYFVGLAYLLLVVWLRCVRLHPRISPRLRNTSAPFARGSRRMGMDRQRSKTC
jgi:hypothetical protein